MTIGLQKSYYSSGEDGGSLSVCVEVLSGELSGQTASVSYTTADGTATGIYEL